jgi:hypothetical protein
MDSHQMFGCAAIRFAVSQICGLAILLGCGAGGSNGGTTDIAAPGGVASDGAAPSPSLTSEPMGNDESGAGGEIGPTPSLLGAADVPCDVATIVSQHCTACHASTPKFNAPMSLMSAGDFSAMAPISSTESVRTVASRRINADGGARMPPPGTVEALSDAERATLTAWLNGGAPSVEGGCAIGEGAAIGGGAAELLPRPTATGTVLAPYEGWDDGDVECFPFVTYDAGDRQSPYGVGTAVDRYMGFGFKPPWEGTRYVRAIRSRIDNEQVLHHWILFDEPSATDGDVVEIVGAHPAGQMLHGWAPGGSDLYFTPDVGMRIDGESVLLLEVHYNSSDPNAVDASGLELCVTETVPENEAVISWLGTDLIAGPSARGTCRPNSDEPIHIIAATPHMHLKGKAMQVTVARADGRIDVVHDEPFAFENQRGYQEDIIINPGDSITTTCSYSAPASFGQGTNDEMCYWFALAYPALADGGLLGRLTHGANACLGL